MSHGVLDDKYWVDAANFVSGLGVPAQLVIAPKELSPLLVGSVPYERRHELATPEVVVLNKGMLAALGREWIEDRLDVMTPAFANEVFVILTRGEPVGRITDSPHFKSFVGMVKALARAQSALAAPPRTAIYLGDYKVLTKTIYGHKIYVDSRDISLTPHIIFDGFWELWVTDAFRGMIKPGMTVVDIGANVGYYALLAADLVGAEGKLIAFEANPGLAELLNNNVAVNGFFDRSKVENKAVFESSGTVQFGVFERYLGASSIYASDAAAAIYKDKIKMIDVPAVSLDDYFAPGEKVDVMKIDAEGSEPTILKGATRVISDNDKIQIIMEFAPFLFKPFYGEPIEFYDTIRAMGLKMHRIEHSGTLVEQTADDLAKIDRHWDVLLRRW